MSKAKVKSNFSLPSPVTLNSQLVSLTSKLVGVVPGDMYDGNYTKDQKIDAVINKKFEGLNTQILL